MMIYYHYVHVNTAWKGLNRSSRYASIALIYAFPSLRDARNTEHKFEGARAKLERGKCSATF